jgi:uncharacterized protein YyaL (SSP411 family)
LHRFLKPAKELVLTLGSDPLQQPDLIHSLLFKLDPCAVTVVIFPDRNESQLQAVCPLTQHRRAENGQATLFVCENSACQHPLVGVEAISAELIAGKF